MIVVIAILINTVTLAVQVRQSQRTGVIANRAHILNTPFCTLPQNPGNQFDFTDPWVNPFLDKLDLVLTTLFT